MLHRCRHLFNAGNRLTAVTCTRLFSIIVNDSLSIDKFSKQILFEDNHIIVVSKPPNVLIQGDNSNDPSLADQVKQYLKVKYNKPGDVFLGIVHRIDKLCSGVIVFAKSSKSAARISESFKTHNIVKRYVTLVQGEMQGSGELHHLLDVRSPSFEAVYKGKSELLDASSIKEAKLKYKVLGVLTSVKTQSKSSLVDVELITGRKHQIRAQLSHIGHPIINDFKYGYQLPGSGNNNNNSSSSSNNAVVQGPIYLHSYLLSFPHPVSKQRVTFSQCKVPESWSSAMYSDNVITAINNKLTELVDQQQVEANAELTKTVKQTSNDVVEV